MKMEDVRDISLLYEEYNQLINKITDIRWREYTGGVHIAIDGIDTNLNPEYFSAMVRFRIEMLEAYFEYCDPSDSTKMCYGEFVVDYMNRGGFFYNMHIMTGKEHDAEIEREKIRRGEC